MAALLQLALAGVEAYRRDATAGPRNRLVLGIAAGVSGIAAMICLSAAALALLAARMSPAEAWAVLGFFYCLAGGAFYLAATRGR